MISKRVYLFLVIYILSVYLLLPSTSLVHHLRDMRCAQVADAVVVEVQIHQLHTGIPLLIRGEGLCEHMGARIVEAGVCNRRRGQILHALKATKAFF